MGAVFVGKDEGINHRIHIAANHTNDLIGVDARDGGIQRGQRGSHACQVGTFLLNKIHRGDGVFGILVNRIQVDDDLIRVFIGEFL